MSHLLLATNTSGKNGSIALARITSGQSDVEIIEAVQLAGGAFSAQLVPQIAALLENHGYRKSDLGAFAVVSGPGSFTGLRVGLAAIKALAEALQKRVAAISLLEAVARSSKAHAAAHSRVLAALDASRGDVYVGNYEIVPETHMHSECLLSREEFLAEAMQKTVVTPDAVLAEAVRAAGMAAGAQVELIEYPSAGVIARLGWEHLQRGQAVGPEELEANYIRHSDAEIFSKPAT
ncbi:MAG TPA: tRNA (adenosine(37)-N6)-threonylcarbamoyltransferase complex dimerization subunit type 1 TsaB [Terriglobales bacterium]|nr:tRNA (adenosine(37)-N6)-threonylcarbamoyltransferase complex dimerization subunit type 1 TsaB [Terriglobales bacterium]